MLDLSRFQGTKQAFIAAVYQGTGVQGQLFNMFWRRWPEIESSKNLFVAMITRKLDGVVDYPSRLMI